jgi:hypothetical protein
MCVESKESLDQWVDALRKAIDDLKEFRHAESEEASIKHLRIADMCDTPQDFMTSSLFSKKM